MALKIHKYPTGAEIPPGSRYLSTQIETRETTTSQINPDVSTSVKTITNDRVWHYFLVAVDGPSST